MEESVIEEIHFGTDGWRGAIAKDYTFKNVQRCTQGFANYLTQIGKTGEKIIIGYDRRFLSDDFALSASEVMAGNEFQVLLTSEPTPTPVISHAVVANKAASAINITASHNPPTDNGYKVRDENGGAIAPNDLSRIENMIPKKIDDVRRIPAEKAKQDGKLIRFDPKPSYIQHIQKLVDIESIRSAGLKVLIDPMWGNGSGWFPQLLSGSKTEIIEIHNDHNPLFPEMLRPEPIPPNIDVGLKATRENQADVLIVNDGDADRIGIGDENGNFINQLQVYALLAYYFLEVRNERGPIVKTLSTTSMLNKLGEIYKVPVHETGVGFKYVAPKMLETDAMIGGEESGGYAFKGNVPERDGILAALFFLDMMVKLNQKPSELLNLLFSKVGPHYYDRIDRRFVGERAEKEHRIRTYSPQSIGGLKVNGLNDMDGFKFLLEDGGWLLIRFSGTEPIIRVYCETTLGDRVAPILQDGLKIAGLEQF
jgi:alpha-D-glucose phosphate-specific phosphoglucomutase